MYRTALLGEGKESIVSYISSLRADREITRETILVLVAHIFELYRLGIIPREKFCKMYLYLRELLSKASQIVSENFERKYEDVHELIESKLINELGADTAGWIGIGRSRNDHVAAAQRIKLRDRILSLLTKLVVLRKIIIEKASRYSNTLFIVYTHGQPAQVTTFGHYLLSVDEVLSSYMRLLLYLVEDIVNKSPLGAGPAAGTLAPIDRERIARSLGFDSVVLNTLYAVETRNYFTLTCSVIVSLLVDLTRLANDLMLYSHPNVGYLKIPDEHCATSSIMPHKRNPVTLEILRARAGQAIGNLTGMFAILHSVGKSYYLDLQEITPLAWSIFDIAESSIEVLADLISRVEVDEKKIEKDLGTYLVTSAETAEHISLSTGKPFREVYFYLAEHIKRGGKIELLPPELVVQQRKILGSGNPEQVLKHISSAENELRMIEHKIAELTKKVQEAVTTLLNMCDEACKSRESSEKDCSQ